MDTFYFSILQTSSNTTYSNALCLEAECNNRPLKALYYATGIEILKMAFKIAGNYVAGNHDLLFLGLCGDLLQHKLNTTTLMRSETRGDANVKVLI